MRVAVAGSIVLLSACSFGALDGFSDGTDQSAADAATADAMPSGHVDAASSADGANAGAGVQAIRCAQMNPLPFACADFDDGTIPPTFARATAGSGDVIVIDQGVAGTKGVAITSTGVATSANHACLRLTLPIGVKRLQIDVDARIDAVGSGDFDFLSTRAPSSVDREVGLHMVTGGVLEFEEDRPTDGGLPRSSYAPTSSRLDLAYRHFRLVMRDAGGAVGEIELFTDGASTGKYSAHVDAFAKGGTIDIGDCVIESAAWKVHLDNILLAVD